MGYFERYGNKDFRFRLKASNGQIILASQGYKSAATRDNGIASVQKNSGDKNRYEVKTAKNGEPYFVLKATNGQVIGQSQMYKSDASCKAGMESVMKNGSTEDIRDGE